MIDPVKLAEAVARGWCHDANSGKVMDPDLVNAIVKELLASDTLRLLAAYAEAARKEVEAWRAAHDEAVLQVRLGTREWPVLMRSVDAARTRSDAARAALVAAGIRVGGGA